MPTRRALVVGAGIAGSATALRLHRSDWDIVLLERNAEFQDLGFPCALRGTGYDAATRLGLMPALIEHSQPRCDTVVVDVAGTPFALYSKPSTATPVLRRADVVTVLRGAIGGAEARKSADVLGLTEDDCGVTVTFSDGDEDWFDLVVGADGVDSAVRGAVFGERHEHGQATVSLSSRLETASASAVRMDLSGRSVRVHPLSGGGSAALFTWRGDASLALQKAFADLAWLGPDLLSQVDAGPVTRRASFQVHADRWVSGQIALVGDAAWCAGRPCGQSASLAIGGAELLGDALDIFTSTAEALAWWEAQMRPIVRHQKQLRPFQTRPAHTGLRFVTDVVARPGEQQDEDCP
ncbi:FAD-dependent oxidoreductase [Lentzea flaviverrucosa]|uniref:2-polyprenyl-6-methoxyphenol hydroxylase n=1 Tax=Lentzea flaviverrucosa TaxID=200379 RepID=A0A1H9XWC0_9PSEU|nr:FAD-dependent monooxygenase [Lentzea flaviverrucosa]RDI34369.1 2-polyprenyl-6-methoxyphenol hydroxylase-like FAD-dependent oxidoreductase [Lentzea flaviverrucosa]SES50460.1 2-polyprenyl-6-methoxyphenol hydroxylase [Lentzea flaviverrucosa]